MKTIRFNVGSGNRVKLEAVLRALGDYELFSGAIIMNCKTNSGVSDQPSSMEETLEGAMTRAIHAHAIAGQEFYSPNNTNFGVGIEDGLMYIPHPGNDYRSSFNCCACSIYDGTKHHIGLGPAYEYPSEVLDFVFRDGMDITQAFNAAGLCQNPRVGEEKGVVYYLSKGAIDRVEYNAQAVRMALMGLIQTM